MGFIYTPFLERLFSDAEQIDLSDMTALLVDCDLYSASGEDCSLSDIPASAIHDSIHLPSSTFTPGAGEVRCDSISLTSTDHVDGAMIVHSRFGDLVAFYPLGHIAANTTVTFVPSFR